MTVIRGPWLPSSPERGGDPSKLERELRETLRRLGAELDQDFPAAPAAESEVVPMSESLARVMPAQFSLSITTLAEAREVATLLAKSAFVPESYRGNPDAVLAAMIMSTELRIGIMQGLQGIAVINGRPSVWGDLALALCQTHPDFMGHLEELSQDGTAARCTMKRRDRPDVVRTFTMRDAEEGKLLNKAGPWQTARKRMLQMRARAYAMRDQFADALRGIGIREEVLDYVVDAQVTASTAANDTHESGQPAVVVSQLEAAAIKAAPAKPPQPTAAAPEPTRPVVIAAVVPPPPIAPVVVTPVSTPSSALDFVVKSGVNAGKKMGTLKESAIDWYADSCKDPTHQTAAQQVREMRRKAMVDAIDRAREAQAANGFDPETGEVQT